VINFNPDERGFFGKMLGKKSTLPDYIKGIITRKSQCVFNEKDNSYTPKDKHFVFAKIEGEWSDYVKFDDTIYWDYSTFAHYNIQRHEDDFVLPSDSTKREDLIILKLGNESEAQKAKVKLEELQRKDRKLRASHGNKHN